MNPRVWLYGSLALAFPLALIGQWDLAVGAAIFGVFACRGEMRRLRVV